jgi:hypothetical protein
MDSADLKGLRHPANGKKELPKMKKFLVMLALLLTSDFGLRTPDSYAQTTPWLAHNVNGELYVKAFYGADVGAKANAAISSATTGATVILPDGDQTISTTIVVDRAITLRGQGAGGRLIPASGFAGPIIDIKKNANSLLMLEGQAVGVRLENIWITGTSTPESGGYNFPSSYPTADGILVEGAIDNLWLRNVTVRFLNGYALQLGSYLGSVRESRFYNLEIFDCGNPTQIAAPSAPTLSQVAGGSLAAATYYAKVAYVNYSGETLASSESSLAVSANYLLQVASPASVAGATGWNVYVSTSSGTETRQNTSPISIGTNWTEPTAGLISGASLPSQNTTAKAALILADPPGPSDNTNELFFYGLNLVGARRYTGLQVVPARPLNGSGPRFLNFIGCHFEGYPLSGTGATSTQDMVEIPQAQYISFDTIHCAGYGGYSAGNNAGAACMRLGNGNGTPSTTVGGVEISNLDVESAGVGVVFDGVSFGRIVNSFVHRAQGGGLVLGTMPISGQNPNNPTADSYNAQVSLMGTSFGVTALTDAPITGDLTLLTAVWNPQNTPTTSFLAPWMNILVGNQAGYTPKLTAGLALGWNVTNGGGETDFVDAGPTSPSSVPRGFAWYDWDQTNLTQLMSLDRWGTLHLPVTNPPGVGGIVLGAGGSITLGLGGTVQFANSSGDFWETPSGTIVGPLVFLGADNTFHIRAGTANGTSFEDLNGVEKMAVSSGGVYIYGDYIGPNTENLVYSIGSTTTSCVNSINFSAQTYTTTTVVQSVSSSTNPYHLWEW